MATERPPMAYQESVLRIPAAGQELLGIVSHPAPGHTPRCAVVVIVGGAQYRVGSHRQFVHLARYLAGAGHTVLRFDLSGMGDSPGLVQSFENTHADIAAAIQALRVHAPGVDRVALWGLCDGASAALLYLAHQNDDRVAGVAMLNPWVRSEASLARAQVRHYYHRRFLDPSFWRKLIAGGVGRQAWTDLFNNLRQMRKKSPGGTQTFQERMAVGLQNLNGPLLVLLSEDDMTANEFQSYTQTHAIWHRLLQQPTVRQHTLAGADHTCSTPGSQALVEQLTLAWLSGL
jgi:uncharacterized protein